ncbi:factor of DNA methylation 1-like [Durio zibethinus]|uniref:Factor of DNA methylation 1-like n=1 Tax=Durio zibethinus TaxID=66656 RepID=A0A6P6AI45_DURZI|nr:factor of DNA methylation 1-like [Durio zibethinus]
MLFIAKPCYKSREVSFQEGANRWEVSGNYDCDDIMLKELRSEWGDEVCKAVSNALLVLNEYNGSGRYIVVELWSFK